MTPLGISTPKLIRFENRAQRPIHALPHNYSPQCPCCQEDHIIDWETITSLEDTISEAEALLETPAPDTVKVLEGHQFQVALPGGTRTASVDLPTERLASE